MADIFQEVDEELRQERAATLWKKYGPYVIAAAVAIVLAVGGHRFWREYQETQRIEASERYQAAVEQIESDPASALDALAAIAADGDAGYAALAALRGAALAVEQGDRETAVRIYGDLARDTATPAPLDGLAAYLSVLHRVGHAEPDALLAAIAPLADGNGPWAPLALELRAVLLLESGDVAGAREVLAALSDVAETPQSLRARAAELLRALPE